jgi:glycogen debranching enzyme
MKRREFLRNSLAGSLAVMASSPFSRSSFGVEASAPVDIRSLVDASDPEVMRLVQDIFRECVLGKLRPPEGTLRRTWITAGGGFYGQWIWDTMFVVDLLSILPGMEQNIRDVFQNYWDFQVRWNEKSPPYAQDMVPCMIEPGNNDWLKYPAYSQIPILAWGLERVYRRNGDRELLRQGLAPLERFHDWYWRERDVTNVGLIAVGSYSGNIQHGRFETFDYECNLDSLKLTVHPTRKGDNEGAWYGDICASGNTAYLIMAENSLMRLAEIVGDKGMAARRKARIEKSVAAMRAHMWDEEAGTFLSVQRDSLAKIPVATIGSWMALMAGVPTDAMAARMAEALQTEHWTTPLPVPTVDRKDPRWVPNSYWRGDVWPAPNYQIATGLARYGHTKLAADIADKTVANAMKHGISEHYDAVSGKPLGVTFLGMSCTIATMMLDGLCSKYGGVKLKKRAND